MIFQTPPARRLQTTSRGRLPSRTPTGGCSSARISSCISGRSSAPVQIPMWPLASSSALSRAGRSASWTASQKPASPCRAFPSKRTGTSTPLPRPRASPRRWCILPPSCSARNARYPNYGSPPNAGKATPPRASAPAPRSATCTTSFSPRASTAASARLRRLPAASTSARSAPSTRKSASAGTTCGRPTRTM